ncbi:hypothetical protein LEMLEM_LOCUS25527 [Lemmus lemmus]
MFSAETRSFTERVDLGLLVRSQGISSCTSTEVSDSVSEERH